jgi:hypothetical protein
MLIFALQEITHIESIDECKQILEAFEWNMESAVQNTFNDQPPIAASSHRQLPSFGLNGNNNNNNESDSEDAFMMPASAASSSSTSSSTSSSASSSTQIPAFLQYQQQAAAAPPQLPPAEFFQQLNATARLVRNQQSLPNVNIHTQRTLTYNSNRQQAVVPRGFFQWSVFIVAFPFKFLMSTFFDLLSFFYSLFDTGHALPDDYDPLANIAEFVINYNQKYGTNHPEFYNGSYAQAVAEAKRDLKFLIVYLHQNDDKDSNSFAS